MENIVHASIDDPVYSQGEGIVKGLSTLLPNGQRYPSTNVGVSDYGEPHSINCLAFTILKNWPRSKSTLKPLDVNISVRCSRKGNHYYVEYLRD